MLLKKEFLLDNLSIDNEKTFSSVRFILKEDELFQQVINKDPEALNYLFFAMKGNGLNLGKKENSFFYKELSSFFNWSNSFVTYIHFVVSNSMRGEFIQTLEDARMSIQNFRYLIQFSNVYDALVEYRKIIEGALWVIEYYENPSIKFNEHLNHEISFMERLEKYPNVKKVYKTISLYMHKKSLLFDENVKDVTKIADVLKLLKSSFEEIKTMYSLLFCVKELATSLPLKRMESLHNVYYKMERKTGANIHIVEHVIIKSAATLYMEGKSKQDIIEIHNKSFDVFFEKTFEKYTYLNSLETEGKELSGMNMRGPLTNEYELGKVLELMKFNYPHKVFGLLKMSALTSSYGSIVFAKNEKVLQIEKPTIENYIHSTKLISTKLLKLEMTGCKEWELFYEIRVLLINFLININLRKPGITHSLFKIRQLLKKNINSDTFVYKHIQNSDRLLYVDSDGRQTGNTRVKPEDFLETIKIIEKYLITIK